MVKNIETASAKETVQPKRKRIQKQVSTQCSICLEPASGKNFLFKLKCNHTFHLLCLQKWIWTVDSKDKKCPNCRKTIPQGELVSFKGVDISTVSSFRAMKKHVIADRKQRKVETFEIVKQSITKIFTNFLLAIEDQGQSQITRFVTKLKNQQNKDTQRDTLLEFLLKIKKMNVIPEEDVGATNFLNIFAKRFDANTKVVKQTKPRRPILFRKRWTWKRILDNLEFEDDKILCQFFDFDDFIKLFNKEAVQILSNIFSFNRVSDIGAEIDQFSNKMAKKAIRRHFGARLTILKPVGNENENQVNNAVES